eukprot:g672.t1
MLHKVSCMAAELTNSTKSVSHLRMQLCTQREAESKAQREADAHVRQCRAELKQIRSQLAAKHSELALRTAECNRIAEESEIEKNSFEATLAAKTRAIEAVANELAELRTASASPDCRQFPVDGGQRDACENETQILQPMRAIELIEREIKAQDDQIQQLAASLKTAVSEKRSIDALLKQSEHDRWKQERKMDELRDQLDDCSRAERELRDALSLESGGSSKLRKRICELEAENSSIMNASKKLKVARQLQQLSCDDTLAEERQQRQNVEKQLTACASVISAQQVTISTMRTELAQCLSNCMHSRVAEVGRPLPEGPASQPSAQRKVQPDTQTKAQPARTETRKETQLKVHSRTKTGAQHETKHGKQPQMHSGTNITEPEQEPQQGPHHEPQQEAHHELHHEPCHEPQIQAEAQGEQDRQYVS